MTRVRPLEVKALVPLLEQDWESPQELASALIATLDQVRASRVSYVGVVRIGSNERRWFLGLGPYAGQRSAEKAVKGLLTTVEGSAYVVVPLWSEEGLEGRLAALDVPPSPTGDWAEV
jgi:hypothetical protein